MTASNNIQKVAFILGAGFSKCAELPVQAEFSPLVTSEDFDSPADLLITEIISSFLEEAFGWKKGREIPALEDVFTSIDLSANNGHYLGHTYSPEMLRALRRMLIYRIFQILDQRFRVCPEIDQLLRHYLPNDCSFIVMNWDIVLEKHLNEIDPSLEVDYVSPSYNWSTNLQENPARAVKICKMHGSGNWMYCENCKSVFYQLDKKVSLHTKVGLQLRDFQLFNVSFQEQEIADALAEVQGNRCRRCHNIFSSHIATFSYRKSFSTAAYSAIWNEAENLLAEADNWIFIGYSLPEADFELKHLIKSAELRIPDKSKHRKIDAVLYQDEPAKNKFERFFGREKVSVYEEGLTEYVKTLHK
jgi:hypothetical protein